MNYYDTVSEVVTAMLEEAAFVFSDPVESVEVSADVKERLTGFKIDFSNYESGSISVFAEQEVAKIIAANMLGCEEDDPEAEKGAESALQEFTNILTGNVITAVYGTKPIIDLSLPVKEIYIEIKDISEKEAVVWMEVEGSYLMVHFIQKT